MQRALESFGGLDILVNNAGGPPPRVALPRFGFLGLDDQDWAAMLDFNLLLYTGRLLDPAEIADAMLLLVSPRSASSELVVDGGLVKAT